MLSVFFCIAALVVVLNSSNSWSVTKSLWSTVITIGVNAFPSSVLPVIVKTMFPPSSVPATCIVLMSAVIFRNSLKYCTTALHNSSGARGTREPFFVAYLIAICFKFSIVIFCYLTFNIL